MDVEPESDFLSSINVEALAESDEEDKCCDEEEEIVGALQPYLFEPETSESDSDGESGKSQADDSNAWRTSDLSWLVVFCGLFLSDILQILDQYID